MVGLLPAPIYPIPLPLPTLATIVQATCFFGLLAVASVSDIRMRVIPDTVCVLAALTGLIGSSPVRLSGALAALPLLIPAMIKQGCIGGGDVKLTAAAGLALGFWGGMAGLIIGLILDISSNRCRAIWRVRTLASWST